jgi:hypothetical protein
MAAANYRGADVVRCWAGLASLGAGLVHAAVVREHWGLSVAHGAFFAVVALAQIGWGTAALARDRLPGARLVIAGNLAVVVLWTASRTVGLPFGPGAGAPEAVGAADLGAVALELVLVAAVALHRWGMVRGPRTSAPGLVAGVAVGALVVGLITTPALAGTNAGSHAHPHLHHVSTDQGSRTMPHR